MFRLSGRWPAPSVWAVRKRTAVPPLPHTWVISSATPRPGKRPPTEFGRKAELVWKEATDDRQRALLAAARNQHNLARGVRAYRDRLGLTTEQVAEAVGLSPDHLRRILRGKAHVSLTDLHLIAAAVDAHISASIKVGREPEPKPRSR